MNRRTRPLTPALGLSAALALVACSEPAPGSRAEAGAPAAETIREPANRDAAASAEGGEGAQIVLNGLTPQDVEAAALPGELACSFLAGGDQVLLLAKGFVASSDPAGGVGKIGDRVERLAAPGGFDGMVRGATFAGRGRTAAIEVTGEPVGGGESPPRPATLTYQRADGARRTFPGQWNCGP